MTAEEEKAAAAGARRLARHEAEARKGNPVLYDLQGNFVYWLDRLSRDRSGAVEKTVQSLRRAGDRPQAYQHRIRSGGKTGGKQPVPSSVREMQEQKCSNCNVVMKF